MAKRLTLYTVAMAAGILAACVPADQTASAPDADPVPAVAELANDPLPMPLPINAMMVSLVDFAADGIWRPAAQDLPLSEEQWLMVEQDAVNLVVSTVLMTTAGTGANDAEFVADTDWRRWSMEMQQVSLQALDAARERDKERLALAGDRLVELCHTCHQKFKPGLPAMGITRFPIYPKRDGT
jgi:hypothetical protein